MEETFKDHQKRQAEELEEKMKAKTERLKSDRFLNALGARLKVEKPKDDKDENK